MYQQDQKRIYHELNGKQNSEEAITDAEESINLCTKFGRKFGIMSFSILETLNGWKASGSDSEANEGIKLRNAKAPSPRFGCPTSLNMISMQVHKFNVFFGEEVCQKFFLFGNEYCPATPNELWVITN